MLGPRPLTVKSAPVATKLALSYSASNPVVAAPEGRLCERKNRPAWGKPLDLVPMSIVWMWSSRPPPGPKENVADELNWLPPPPPVPPPPPEADDDDAPLECLRMLLPSEEKYSASTCSKPREGDSITLR